MQKAIIISVLVLIGAVFTKILLTDFEDGNKFDKFFNVLGKIETVIGWLLIIGFSILLIRN